MENHTMEEIKHIIRSIAISGSLGGMSVKSLVQDFKKIEGFDLPYQRLGFRTADDFLRSLPDTVTVEGYGTSAIIEPIVTKRNQHIRDMVQLSKPNSRRRPFQNYVLPAYRTSNKNNGRFNNTYSDNNNFTNRTSNYGPPETSFNALDHDVPRKVSNREYDFLETLDGNDSESSDDGPKFVVTEGKKLEQVDNVDTMQDMNVLSQPSRRCEEAIPDNVLRLINSVSIPEDAMNHGDTIEAATIPENIIPKESVKIFVTEVHNPNRVWFHFQKNAEAIADLMNELEVYYSNLAEEEWRLKPSNVAVGLYCAALFFGMWHRAKIVEDLVENKIKVFFIDYGTVSLIELKDAKFLAKCFQQTPAQSMRASLAYLKPNGHWWTHEASWELLSLVSEKILSAYVVDVDRKNNFLDVVLLDTTKTKDRVINKLLSIKGHAIWEQDPSYEEMSVEIFRCRTKSFWELFPRFDDLENGSYPSLVELADSLSAGFNFEQYCTRSLWDDDPYLKTIMSKALTIDHKMFLNTDSAKIDDNINHMSATSSQLENDEYFCQVPTIFETETDQTTVTSNSYAVSEMEENVNAEVDLESQDTVNTQIVRYVSETDGDTVLEHRKQVEIIRYYYTGISRFYSSTKT